ncbi:unnamed protein product [marine sediment metagenome]|uniref:Uncharacterized protein n=1 Tax=marine sediment metagenome TaxID=412755 RepID=X1C5H2_9ZZZZ
MEDFQYMNEVIIGGSSTLGGIVVALLKKFGNQLRRMEERISELEKELAVNTALDKHRNGKR